MPPSRLAGFALVWIGLALVTVDTLRRSRAARPLSFDEPVTTRYVLLLHLPDDHTAETVDTAMRHAIAKLPGELFRTITWDKRLPGSPMDSGATAAVAVGLALRRAGDR